MLYGESEFAQAQFASSMQRRGYSPQQICRILTTHFSFRVRSTAALVFALSFFFWGIAYSASRCSPHPSHTSRALQTKVWDRHEEVRGELPATSTTAAPFPLALPLEVNDPEQAPEEWVSLHAERSSSPPITLAYKPLRSPPSRSC